MGGLRVNVPTLVVVTASDSTVGITMPSATAQARLIRETYQRCGLDINSPLDRPQYFEAHGTGTPAGDRKCLYSPSSLAQLRR